MTECRYRQLVDGLRQHALFMLDDAGRIKTWSTGASALTGYKERDILDKHLACLYPPDEQDAAQRDLADARADAVRDCERWLVRRDGTPYRARVVLNRIDGAADGISFGGIATDISDRYREAEELAVTRRELERSNEELEQFAYVASHDLSEPLRAISGYVQLLARRYEGKLDDDADRFIAFVVEGARRMQALIDDLLAYSRVGRVERPWTAVDTGRMVDDILRNLRAVVDAADAEVVHGQLPTVSADATQLAQVFQNLLTNSLKFRREGIRPHVAIEAELVDGCWRFSVTDNGIGIAEQHRDRIFRMFQRLHRRDQYEGTGIGLAVSKKIVEGHGGQLWVEDGPDGGARFCFTIVAKDEEAQQ